MKDFSIEWKRNKFLEEVDFSVIDEFVYLTVDSGYIYPYSHDERVTVCIPKDKWQEFVNGVNSLKIED